MRGIMVIGLLVTILSPEGLLARQPVRLGDKVVTCEGWYPQHLQGVDWDRKENIYWSFTSRLVRTDLEGKKQQVIEVPGHHGDLCFYRQRVYVAVNFGSFNDPNGNAKNEVFIYRADNLEFISRHPIPEVKHGAGGMTWQRGRFVVIGGLPEGYEENYFYEYDQEFRFLGRKVCKSGYSRLGIQAICSSGRDFWCGCYGSALLRVGDDYEMAGRWEFDTGYGLLYLGGRQFMVTRGTQQDELRGGELLPARWTNQDGLRVRPSVGQ